MIKLNSSLKFLWIIILVSLVSTPILAHWFGGAHCDGRTCSKSYEEHPTFATNIDMQIIFYHYGNRVVRDSDVSLSETQPSLDVGNFGLDDECETSWGATASLHGQHCHGILGAAGCHRYLVTRGGESWTAMEHLHNITITTDGFSLDIEQIEYTAVIMKQMVPFDFCGADLVSGD